MTRMLRLLKVVRSIDTAAHLIKAVTTSGRRCAAAYSRSPYGQPLMQL